MMAGQLLLLHQSQLAALQACTIPLQQLLLLLLGQAVQQTLLLHQLRMSQLLLAAPLPPSVPHRRQCQLAGLLPPLL
jgi:hypothetical protein